MKKIIIITFVLIPCLLLGQDISFSGKQINATNYLSLKRKGVKAFKAIKEIEIYEINGLDIYFDLNKNTKTDKVNLQLKLGDKHDWQIELREHNLFSENFRRVKQTSHGKEISYTPPKLKIYRSYNKSKAQKGAFSLGSNWIYGSIWVEKDSQYFIEPLQIYDSNAKSNLFIVYKADESDGDAYVCRQNGASSSSDIENSTNKQLLAVSCMEIAIAYDQSAMIEFGTSRIESILTSRFNVVSSFFLNNFEIDKKIIEFYEAGNNEITLDTNMVPCNEVYPNCSDNSILDDFREWGEKENDPNSGFSSNPDAATFFTGRGVTDFFGYSHFGGICNERGYNWVEEDIPYLEYRKANLWIHEYGHTWNASHINDPSNMMYSSISSLDNMQVHAWTYNSIIGHKNSRSCLSDGACSTLSTNNIAANVQDVKVFPNPTTDILNIKTKARLKKIEVYNNLGQKILETNQNKINIHNFSNGIFLLKIHGSGGEIALKKIIKV